MRTAVPKSLGGALEAMAAMPGAQLLAGGTDFAVEVNFGHRQPSAIVGLRRVAELRDSEVAGDEVTVGAGVSYSEVIRRLGAEVPALAGAARTVGSPQIRNAGTIGGNLATASPAGDTLPVLAALGATVTLASAGGRRELAVSDLVTGVKRTCMREGEIIVSVKMPKCAGPQHYLKVGTRNAMVIAVASVAVVVDLGKEEVSCVLGSVAPVPLRALAAEAHAAGTIDWRALRAPEPAVRRFGALAAEAAAPITDHRASAVYRRRAVEVIASRALRRCLADVA